MLAVFILKQLIKERKEFSLETYVGFIDHEKAFYTEIGYPKVLVYVIQVYCIMEIVCTGTSSVILVNNMIRQHCIMLSTVQRYLCVLRWCTEIPLVQLLNFSLNFKSKISYTIIQCTLWINWCKSQVYNLL